MGQKMGQKSRSGLSAGVLSRPRRHDHEPLRATRRDVTRLRPRDRDRVFSFQRHPVLQLIYHESIYGNIKCRRHSLQELQSQTGYSWTVFLSPGSLTGGGPLRRHDPLTGQRRRVGTPLHLHRRSTETSQLQKRSLNLSLVLTLLGT